VLQIGGFAADLQLSLWMDDDAGIQETGWLQPD